MNNKKQIKPNRHPANRVGKHGGTKPAFTAQGNLHNGVPTETRGLGNGYYCIVDVARNVDLEKDIAELKAYVKGVANGNKDNKRDAKKNDKSNPV